jgi:anthraniloyl-CoA monooxygenase
VWPAAKPLSVRLSASDWLDDAGGQTVEDSVAIAAALKARGVDVIDVSSAGNSLKSKPEYGRMYQASFADAIRHGAGVPVIAVGGISDADQANTLLAAGACDLVAIARAHLSDPYLTLHAAAGLPPGTVAWPKQYLAVRR